MGEKDILQALIDKLKTLVLSPTLPIAYPNVNFKVPSNGRFLRCFFLPGETLSFSVENTGSNRHIGVFQVDVNWTENEGVALPYQTADAILAHFKRGTRINSGGVYVDIVQPPYLGPLMNEEGRAVLPVSIPYVAFLLN